MVHFVKRSLLSLAVAPLALTVAVQGQAGQAKPPTPADLNPAPIRTTSVLLTSGDSPWNCPVAVKAQMRSGGGVLTTGIQKDGDHAATPGQLTQHIRVTLAPSILTKAQNKSELDGNRLPLQAKVTVKGTNGTWRVVNSSTATAGPSQPRSPWIEKTLELNLIPVTASDKSDSVYADLELPGFTSVQSIRLDSIAYANGSSWTPVSGRACRVAPDPLMLISTR